MGHHLEGAAPHIELWNSGHVRHINDSRRARYGALDEEDLVGGLEPDYFSIYWEFHHPNWRTHVFQRGRYTTNQNGTQYGDMIGKYGIWSIPWDISYLTNHLAIKHGNWRFNHQQKIRSSNGIWWDLYHGNRMGESCSLLAGKSSINDKNGG